MIHERTILPRFFVSGAVCSRSPWAQLLYIVLAMLADRAGRLEDQPAVFRDRLFRFDRSATVDDLIVELESAGLVRRYASATGRRFIQLPEFEQHFRPYRSEPPSTLPAESAAIPSASRR